MKSVTLYTCFIVMLILSSVTFGEILADPEATGTSASASASASKGNPEDYDYEQRWWYEYTTEAGTFQWYIEADAFATCSATEDNGWVLAVGDASGAAASPYSVVSVDARVSLDYTYSGLQDDPPADTDSGYDEFDANQGVSGQCDAFAYAGIEEGSQSSASSSSDSIAYPAMSE